MKEISATDILSTAWTKFTENIKSFLLISLVYVVITSLPSFIRTEDTALTLIVTLVSFIINLLMALGVMAISLHYLKTGEVEFDQIFDQVDLLPSYFIASLFAGILVILGLIFFIIPGFYIMMRIYMFPFILIEEECGPIEALSSSWELTKGHVFDIFTYSIIMFFASVAAIIFTCGLGYFVVTPVAFLAQAILYKELQHASDDTEDYLLD